MDGLRELGALVRQHRSDAGLSGAELARRAGVSQPSVWRVESGRRLSRVAVVEQVVSALALNAAAERRLFDLARGAYGDTDRPRVDSGVSMVTGQFRRYLLDTRVVRSFSSAAIPELLRTPDYAKAAGYETGGQRDIAGLLDDASRSFAFVLAESSLRTWPGMADMAAQLSRVMALADRPNVRVEVIPSGAALPRMPLHGFTLLDDRAVWVETFTAELTLTNSDDVAAYAGCFAGFEEAAVFGNAMQAVVRRAAVGFTRISKS
jgi:transcriptional regulator with XRE-family HTH domain